MAIESDFDVLDYEAGADDEVLGAECCSCFRLLRWKFFPRNSAYKSGYGPQCYWCLSQPALSIKEHTARLQELNFNSEGTRRQRHPDQEEFHKDRRGKYLSVSDFLLKLHEAYPRLFVIAGGIIGDVSLYATSGTKRPDWNNQDFKYIGYVTLPKFTGDDMPEYTEYEFDQSRDILLRATKIGWRSVLLRFVENDLISEEQCNKIFGPATGDLSLIWRKKTHKYRLAKSRNDQNPQTRIAS